MPDKRVTVKVVFRSDAPLDFDIESNDLPKDAEGNLVFENHNHSGFQVEFEFVDVNALGYFFPPNSKKSEAVWSKLCAPCPDSACDEVFKVLNVSHDCKTLAVRNANVAPVLGKFGYTLRVTKDGGANYLPLDPGGVNQNGPVRQTSIALMFISGGVLGSLLTLGAQALLFN